MYGANSINDFLYDQYLIDQIRDALDNENVWRSKSIGQGVKQVASQTMQNVGKNPKIRSGIVKKLDHKDGKLANTVIKRVSQKVSEKTGKKQEEVSTLIVGGLAIADHIKNKAVLGLQQRGILNPPFRPIEYTELAQEEPLTQILPETVMPLAEESITTEEMGLVAAEAIGAVGLSEFILPVAALGGIAYGLYDLF